MCKFKEDIGLIGQHICLAPPGLGVRFLPLFCVCCVCIFSLCIWGFFPQSKEMHCRLIGISKVVCSVLEVIFEDIISKTVPEVCRLTFAMAQDMGVLRREYFERSVVTLVYMANKIAQANTAHQKDAWAECFNSLYKAIKHELTIGQGNHHSSHVSSAEKHHKLWWLRLVFCQNT